MSERPIAGDFPKRVFGSQPARTAGCQRAWPMPGATRALAGGACAIGLAALGGWIADVPTLKSVLPGYIAMQPWTAVSLILGAVALFLTTLQHPVAWAAASVAAVALGFAGGMPLLEYLSGFSFGSDTWVLPARVVSGQTFAFPNPGRMSQAAASGFTALAVALLLAPHGHGRFGRAVFSALATAALTLAILAWLNYMLRFETHDTMFMRNPLALHSALGLGFLAVGTLACRADVGWVRMATDYGRAGWMTALLIGVGALLLICGVDAATQAGTITARASTASQRLEILLSTLKDAETGERGYLVSGKESYLAPYEAAGARLASDIAAVKGALAAVKDRPLDLSRLSGLIDNKMAVVTKIIALRRTHDIAGTLALVELDGGKTTMDAVRAEVASLMQAVDKDAMARSTRAHRTAAIAAALLAALGGLAAWALFTTSQAQRDAVQARDEAAGRLALFIDGAPVAIAMFDTRMRYLAVSRRFVVDYHLDDQTPASLLGRCHYDAMPDIPDRWRRIHARVLAGESLSAEDDAFIRSDGAINWQRWEMVPWRHADGTIGGALLFAENTTPRKLAEAAFRDSETRLRLVQQVGRVAYFDRKLPESTVLLNAEAAIMYGLPADQTHIQAEEWMARVHPADLDRVQAARTRLLEGRGPVALEFRIRRLDNATRWVALRGDIVPGADGTPPRLLIAQHDITDIVVSQEALVESEARLRHSQVELSHALRVSTVGEMASATAHELGQPLSAAGSFLEGCTALLQSNDSADKDLVLSGLGRVAAAIERASVIVRNLRRFLRKEEAEYGAVDLNGAVSDALRLVTLGFDRNQGGQVVFDPAHDLPLVVADRTQIQQVVVNLVRNAVEAMVTSDIRAIRVATRRHDAGVRLIIADTGPGLPAEIADAPFKPFATTKENGLGLGLSICRSIIAAHKGSIGIESGPRGTTFYVDLPAAQDDRHARAA